jgi:hypothetical protein
MTNIFGQSFLGDSDLISEIPMCEVCGCRPATNQVTRWHNNLMVESKECISCAIKPIPFETNPCLVKTEQVSYKGGVVNDR